MSIIPPFFSDFKTIHHIYTNKILVGTHKNGHLLLPITHFNYMKLMKCDLSAAPMHPPIYKDVLVETAIVHRYDDIAIYIIDNVVIPNGVGIIPTRFS
ncbi:MAG: hypothetical protein Faunusvirus17_11 [Faunusvirus sp.]|jgi:hypothetical protein|uniref:Uncharacterized protein n=1 Tax=Faunusvirus sp. TaxID=2487766 RepID=A0A3G4ZX50_9VIRU|nr:MAG: hypothetical protein Faunusvirus17_11 [Faunusvirus sp.]